MQAWEKQKGFTLVELLIVVIVIAILAAITVVAYNGVQNRAHDSSIKNDLRNIAQAILQYKVLSGSLPKGSADMSAVEGLKVSGSAYGHAFEGGGHTYNLVYCWPNSAHPESFALVASSKSGNVFEYNNGSVEQADYEFVEGSETICNDAGNPIDGVSERDWFFNQSAWQQYVEVS